MDLQSSVAGPKLTDGAVERGKDVVIATAPPSEQLSAGSNNPSRDEQVVAANADVFQADAREAGPGRLPDSAIAALAVSLLEPVDLFLQRLGAAVGSKVAFDGPSDLYEGDEEEIAFEGIATDAVDEIAPAAAAVICAALAARIFARAVVGHQILDHARSEALLSGWIETARSVVAVRGQEGLLRLLPTARRLALRHDEEGDRIAAIAAAMHHVASRISAGSARTKRATGAPRRHDSEGAGTGAATTRDRIAARRS
jgi:hypothetical protein